MLHDIKKIDSDVPSEEQIMMSLDEGKTVLIYGIIGVEEGRIAESVGIYRFLESSANVTGWVFIRYHPDKTQNGFHFYALADLSIVRRYPAIVAFIGEVDAKLADKKTNKTVLQTVIDMVIPSDKPKRKLN